MLVALAFAGDALATTYYYCYVRDYNGNELRYYSDIMSTSGEIVIAADGSVTWRWPRASTGTRLSVRGDSVHFEQVIVEKDGSASDVITHKLLRGNLPPAR